MHSTNLPDGPPSAYRFAVRATGGCSTTATAGELIRGIYAGEVNPDDYELVIAPVTHAEHLDDPDRSARLAR